LSAELAGLPAVDSTIFYKYNTYRNYIYSVHINNLCKKFQYRCILDTITMQSEGPGLLLLSSSWPPKEVYNQQGLSETKVDGGCGEEI
jgi:hypothetical protein